MEDTSIFSQKEDDLNFFPPKGRWHHFFFQVEDELNFFFKSCNSSVAESKWKKTLDLLKIEDDQSFIQFLETSICIQLPNILVEDIINL